jgi:hypothetical protein
MNIWSLLRPGLGLATLTVRALFAVVAYADGAGRDRDAGICPVCGRPVRASDAHVRFRGAAYHAEPCAEQYPPAETARRSFAF